jgi:hypothetical protein
MTTAESPMATDSALVAEAAPESAWVHRWLRLEAWLDRMGDRLNPILVKEARQAMKSRQFVVTFSLLLIFGWIYTVGFIAFSMPGLYYAPLGSAMLVGYYLILTIPLLIVVPYAAFRSLASEREDGTFELLSITALSARQIVTGKLASAVLQMLVYYSALAPCIAFTYLLRGIDIVTIGLFLAYTFLASLGLSVFGLMLATVTRSRHWQVVLSVVYVMALLGFAVIWDSAILSVLADGGAMPYDEPEFWIINLMIFSFYFSFMALSLLIAAGQLTFASENRSTKLRVVLLLQQALLLGWMTYFWVMVLQRGRSEEEILVAEISLAGAFWMFAGAFLTGEAAELSPRARRQLPQSLLGRMAFTWFNPGSGTGYVFALLNLGAASIVVLACLLVGQAWGTSHLEIIPWVLAIWGYVAAYLGITRMLIVWARMYTSVSLLAVFLCHVCVVALGSVVPFIMQAAISRGDPSQFVYSPLQLPNWVWTLYEIGEDRTGMAHVLGIVVFLFGAAVFIVNLVLASREVENVRQAAPQRVLEDERELHPPPSEKKVALSPWDK